MSQAYSISGVSLNRAYRILDLIAKKNRKPVTHFASVVDLPRHSRESGNPDKEKIRLVFSADGVGTKIELLAALGLNKTSGWDCVAMNTNDLLCRGARPLWFLDYFSQNQLQPKVFDQVLSGLKGALKAVGAELVGGETAELPGLFANDEVYELAGFAAGLQDPAWNLSPDRVKPGDLLIGLPSSGPHSNGFSLIRKSLTLEEVRRNAKALLAPTRLYHPMVWPLLKYRAIARHIHSMAHITGGGFIEKLPRAMNNHCQAVLDLSAWKIPDIFLYLEKRADIIRKESLGVWNMGIGFVLFADSKAWPQLFKRLGGIGKVIGAVRKRGPSASAVAFF